MIKTTSFNQQRVPNLRRRVLAPLILAICLLQGSFLATFYHHQRLRIQESQQTTAQRVKDLFHQQINRHVLTMNAALDVLIRDSQVMKVFQERNRNALRSKVKPLYERLRQQNQITHFYFHLPDRINFLRVHKDIFGDRINRITLQRAEQTGKPDAGLEQGPTGNPVLRSVYPWRRDFPERKDSDLFAKPEQGELVGYVELGIEFQDIAQQVHQILDVDLVLAMDKQFLKQQEWENRNHKLGYQSNWSDFPNYVIVDKTVTKLPELVNKEIGRANAKTILTRAFKDATSSKQMTFLPLIDIDGRNLGHIVIIKDVSKIERSVQQSVLLVTLFSLTVGSILVGLFYILLGQVERNILAQNTQLTQSTYELQTALEKLKQSQLQLVQAEKMSSLGNLVAGVAHEINNPLGFLSGSLVNHHEFVQDLLEHLSLYQQEYKHPNSTINNHAEDIDLEYLCEDLPKISQSMQEATKRIKTISNSLRTFSRNDTESKVFADLHECLDSTLLILKYRLKENEKRPAIKVITEYGDLPKIECFPGQLNQVFMNILANAIDALDESNTGCNFETIKKNPNVIKIKTSVVNNYTAISIADNGKGMSQEVQQKIFDYLFTTKSVGQGTGLGLAIAKQIIEEKHGGKLSCHSVLNEGTEFLIKIPL